MDVFDVLLQAGLITTVIVAYLLVFRRDLPMAMHGNYKVPGWNYPLKLLLARYVVSQWKKKLRPTEASEFSNVVPTHKSEGWDALTIRTTATDGTALLWGIRILYDRQLLSEINLIVNLPDGTRYVLPQHPDSSVGAWEHYHHGWSANGLKFQVLEPALRMRITYNGLMTRDDNTTQHVRLNLIWTAASRVVRHPDDWSTELAAQALAYEPWRDHEWSQMLGKNKDGGWLQFGSMQGRFEAYDEEGTTDKSVYLQTRGLKERDWSEGYKDLRKSVRLTASSVDGTVVHLRCLSYKNVLTQCISGSIRFPNSIVESITSTDLIMSHFCETPAEIPKIYSINVSSKKRALKLIIRINSERVTMPSGVPYKHEVHYRTFVAEIDGFAGSGVFELGYKPSVVKEPAVRLNPARILQHLSMMEAGATPDYCLAFEDRRAACSDLTGGKGASLALLASMQIEEGYRVPPGFCLTINALNKHLEQNAAIKAAVLEIEAANVNYEERFFKQKCEAAVELFAASELSGDVKEEVLANIAELRIKATEQNLGKELRFAVRSSAVGEDSEVLSAAGQNETKLGCVSDEDILRAIVQCWASMFAFTSAYYRRQNGQACQCGGGVVIQALVLARAAGVLFTRHPARGDPTRLLLTANYGLGESVVSGAIEPDTFIVKRGKNLSLSKTILGTKTQRITVNNQGVGLQEVPASERETACLSEGEVIRLARLGVVQEELWAAPRDIEWAIVGDDVFLLQARPITSLERWTEEELLHELDCPIMADDELISFGNTGEVLPRPLTPMSYDVMKEPLTKGVDAIVGKTHDYFDPSVITTHYRCALLLFNTIYETVPHEMDINIRMIEMAIHGHNVADDAIMSSALHRRAPRWYDKIKMIRLLIKALLTSKRSMNQAIKNSKAMTIGEGVNDPYELWQAIADAEATLLGITKNHGLTSMASTSSQFISMNVLLEGRTDFSPELCNEIGTLLSSGDVLSAEVPQALASLARKLEASGKYGQFRELDPKDAMQWLKTNLPTVHSDVVMFLEQHGHRAIMELELLTKPWVLVPEEMMKVLQNLQSTAESKAHSKTDAEIIASLKSLQKNSTRKVLKWVMPLCRRTVRHREGTKAHLILAVHKIRLAFLRLGRELVKRWYLPNVDLVFFFRFQELKNYIQTRDPALLRKASQRQQHYPGWCKLKFAEINQGWPVPLAARAVTVTSGDVKIEGATVCGGVVMARACVVKDLSEIDQLQQGDILITHATDIGWSPYFPLLSGIVTELGGLISHGAVIAREYGLPCIVGAKDATDIFKTGDMVRLSGTDGTLERVLLEKTEQSEQSSEK